MIGEGTAMRQRLRLMGVAMALLAILGGCGPEARRARGGGLGGDIGNHARPEIPASKVWNTHDPAGARQDAGTNQESGTNQGSH